MATRPAASTISVEQLPGAFQSSAALFAALGVLYHAPAVVVLYTEWVQFHLADPVVTVASVTVY